VSRRWRHRGLHLRCPPRLSLCPYEYLRHFRDRLRRDGSDSTKEQLCAPPIFRTRSWGTILAIGSLGACCQNIPHTSRGWRDTSCDVRRVQWHWRLEPRQNMTSLLIASTLGSVALICARIATHYGGIAERRSAEQSATANRWAVRWAGAAAILGFAGAIIEVWPGSN
jgi:hypothetical protein